MICAAILRNEE